MRRDQIWTPVMDAELTTLWNEGKTTKAIVYRMAWRGVVSKNAVVGRARRLGLAKRASPIKRLGTGETPQPPKPRVRTLKEPGTPRARSVKEPVEQRDANAEAAQVARLLVQAVQAAAHPPAPPPAPAPLTASAKRAAPCCWPLGEPRDPAFRFCEEPVVKPGASYCAAHAARAFQKAPARSAASFTFAPVQP